MCNQAGGAVGRCYRPTGRLIVDQTKTQTLEPPCAA